MAGTAGTPTAMDGGGGSFVGGMAGERIGGGGVAGLFAGDAGQGGVSAAGRASAGSLMDGGAAGLTGAAGGSSAGYGGVAGATLLACLLDSDCAGTECRGSAEALACVGGADVCDSDDECARHEYCDGFCRPAAGEGEPCSPGERCGRLGDGRKLTCDEGLCLHPTGPGDVCGFIDRDYPELSFTRDCPEHTLCFTNGMDVPEDHCWPLASLGQTCSDVPVDLGNESHLLPCDEGLYCTLDMLDLMSDFTCQRPAEWGPCLPTGAPPCASGQYCQWDSECPDHIKEWWSDGGCPYCSDPLTQGLPCPLMDTVGGFACAIREDCVAPLSPACAPGLFCGDDGSGALKCLPSPGAGEPCVVPAEQAEPGQPACTDAHEGVGCSPCGDGLLCNGGICQPAAGYGEQCDELLCAPGLRCVATQVDGICAGL